VITSNFLPEFGRNTGAVVDIVSRGGMNDLHSDLYWVGRYDALGARDFFNHQLNAAGQVVAKDAYRRNTFGGSTGGPLVRNKTFWFANYEGQRFSTTLTNNSVVPTEAFKSGQFTYAGRHRREHSQFSKQYLSTASGRNDAEVAGVISGSQWAESRRRARTAVLPEPLDHDGDNVTARVDHNLSSGEH